ncbi:MAG: hypothetical protein WD512_17905 [Candidatus Paceibacterota bacterium]
MKQISKKPWLAALLNILLSGAGYLYIGKRKILGLSLSLGELTALMAFIFEPELIQEFTFNIWLNISSIILIIGLAVDAYNEAKSIQ